ncbi:MAG: helix-turn-helix transcriptional regulator [Bacilli bacterium]|nr:helix-turn-helix transcriptional regulator [Bacilli bacterium]
MFKDKLKELREKSGISQYELAEKILFQEAQWLSGKMV